MGIFALTDDSGEVREIQGIGLDVTDKVMAQDVKEEAIQTLSYAMTYAKMGSWKLDFATKEIKLSKEFKALLALEQDAPAFPLEDFLNRFIVPENLPLIKKEFEDALMNKDVKDYELSFTCRVITNEGWMRYISVKGKAMNQNTSFGIAQDIIHNRKNQKMHCSTVNKNSGCLQKIPGISSACMLPMELSGTCLRRLTAVLGYEVV